MYSCKQQLNTNHNSFRQLISDTVQNKMYNEAYASNRRSVGFNLSPIENGVDSFELRMWAFNYSKPNLLVILRYNLNKWQVNKYEYYTNDGLIDSMNVRYVAIPPEVNSIIAYLGQKQILGLPSQIAIPDFDVNTNVIGAQSCVIEMSTKSYYKGLAYFCPERFTYEPNNAKFIELINYLNRYFNFYESRCKPYE